MTSIKPMKITFKKMEAEWYNYHNTLREIVRLEEEIMNPFKEDIDENVGGGRSTEISRPTERIATRLATHKQLLYLKEVTDAIKQVYDSLPDNYKKLVRLKYWNKNNDLTWEGIALELNVSEKQARRWRDKIIYSTMELLGWR